MIYTQRLRLDHLADRHLEPFSEMHYEPEVMEDLGGPIDRAEANVKFDRYLAARATHGVARWSRIEMVLFWATAELCHVWTKAIRSDAITKWAGVFVTKRGGKAMRTRAQARLLNMLKGTSV